MQAARNLSSLEPIAQPFVPSDFGLEGTVIDHQLLVGWSASGFPWTLIVVVPAGDSLYGVLLPPGDRADAIATWSSFMSNDNQRIAVKIARSEPSAHGGAWSMSTQTWRTPWPKG